MVCCLLTDLDLIKKKKYKFYNFVSSTFSHLYYFFKFHKPFLTPLKYYQFKLVVFAWETNKISPHEQLLKENRFVCLFFFPT